jgi:DNA-binding XRE family transcriptional regulator
MINQFKKARKQKQMSINELSTRVGVTRQTINNVEKGKCRNLTTLEKIASALNKKLTITLN